MEDANESFKKKVPVVHYDEELDKYSGIVLFPHKVAKAKEAFEKLGLPDLSKLAKEPIEETGK